MSINTKRRGLVVALVLAPSLLLGVAMPLAYLPFTVFLGVLTSLVGTEIALRVYPISEEN